MSFDAERNTTSPAPWPLATVILPVRNEAAYIERSLYAVLKQEYPSECLQVIVADGNSDDGTVQIIQAIQQRYPNLELIENPARIVPTGMNLALRRARGAIVVRVDGHCEIAPDYVRRCVEHLQADEVDGVGGAVQTLGETPLARTISLAMSSPFGVGDSAFRTIQGRTLRVDTVPFPAYTRDVIQRAGLYDEELVRNQDDEYNYRLGELGAKLLLAADVHSLYYSRVSLKALWRQYYQYGFWKVRVLQKHPRQVRWRQLVPPTFVLSLLLGLLLSLFFPLMRLLWGGIVALYAMANGAASLRTGWRREGVHLFALPLIYAILHFSYGLGFLAGLVHFAGRWGDRQGKVPRV